MRYDLSSLLRFTTFADRVIIVSCILLSFSSLVMPFAVKAGDKIQIEINGKIRYAGALFEKNELRFQGETGVIIIQTGPEGVRINKSACPNQICVRQGWRKGNHEVIVCVPNDLIIQILSSTASQLGPMDSTTR